ncbi:MAG: hypothetical protein P1U89_12850 [Verrucomicrobiales bacterium]|nr:hypothetical protein [Verrucomicrobiales bacterium]
MKSTFESIIGLSLLFVSSWGIGEEGQTVAFFEKAGVRITKNDEGKAVKFFSRGNPPHTVEELQKIGKLIHLEQLALNAPAAGDGDWRFLHDLKQLKQLTIWHGKAFSSLAPFCDLPIEGLTVGGCMGIRNLNQGNLQKQRDVVLTLQGLPNLRRLNLYHSPLIPDDAHLAHIAKQFPKLVDLKLDFNAPRGSETTISPDGLRSLKTLPLTDFSMENIGSFTADHMKAIAEIETLEAVLIDARRSGVDSTVIDALKSARPDLEVVVAEEGTQSPPRRSRRKN